MRVDLKPFRPLGTCVSCGRQQEMGATGWANHQCSAKHEGGVASANTRFAEAQLRMPPWAERLAAGVDLCRLAGDGIADDEDR